ncbi:MAG: hypothetical protein JWN03_4228 [Nocardia sp.]|uniref:hypothetical protein n=1 Tax=Nocardia sp. TaxID=1821 RepID=UPI0026169976|nr:hypothetical protein [Nocardia sp.]MCU1643953.1 hypothetical protein [Nocardia sp.]
MRRNTLIAAGAALFIAAGVATAGVAAADTSCPYPVAGNPSCTFSRDSGGGAFGNGNHHSGNHHH